jgi:hypothetical protein
MIAEDDDPDGPMKKNRREAGDDDVNGFLGVARRKIQLASQPAVTKRHSRIYKASDGNGRQ